MQFLYDELSKTLITYTLHSVVITMTTVSTTTYCIITKLSLIGQPTLATRQNNIQKGKIN